MARLDTWQDSEIAAAVTALAGFSDWAQGAVGVGRVAQQAQVDAELTRLVNLVPFQGSALVARVPYNVSGLAAGKIEQEMQWRLRAP
jgi:hypothetical protein